MCLHDLIADEFARTKSLSALIYLIERGREVQFSFRGKEYFISNDKSQKYVSLWEGQNEQSFDSVEALLEHAALANSALLSVWPEVQIGTVF